MNSDFENHLGKQPIKPVPADWKNDILREAHRSAPQQVRDASAFESLRNWLRDLLWPSPAAWGGLAALWAVLLAIGSIPAGENAEMLGSSTPLTPRQVELVKQQKEWLREELAAGDLVLAPVFRNDPAAGDGPRSEALPSDLHRRTEYNRHINGSKLSIV
jgi:hypothetical protein